MNEPARRWAKLLEEHEASELTLQEFAARRNVSVRTLQWWRWKLRKLREEEADEQPPIAFVPVEIQHSPRETIVVRIERLGIDIHLDDDFDPLLLQKIVGALC